MPLNRTHRPALVRIQEPIIRFPTWLRISLALANALVRLAVWTVRSAITYPRETLVIVGVLWLFFAADWRPVVLIGASGLATAIWALKHRSSFLRFIGYPVLSRIRFWLVYKIRWPQAMTLSGLGKTYDQQPLAPKLVTVTSDQYGDLVTVRMLLGQSPQHYTKTAIELAHSFGTRVCRVSSRRMQEQPLRRGRWAWLLRFIDAVRFRDRPGIVQLLFIRRDPLATPVSPLSIVEQPELAALPVGRREDSHPYLLRLLETHLLIAGATGAGKGSVIWSIPASPRPWNFLWSGAAVGD